MIQEPGDGTPPGQWPSSWWSRLTPWQWAMLAVAAVAAIVLIAIVVWPDSDGEVVTVDTTTAPSTTAPPAVVTVPATGAPTTPAPTTAPVTAPTTAAPTTAPAPPTTPPGPRLPSQAVAVTVDGRLVVLDTAGGQASEIRLLEQGPDPRIEVEEGDGSYIGGPALSPDGTQVYFHYCCEPVVGDLFRVPVDGSAEAERLGYGSDPAVSPAGDRLAYVAYDTIIVRDLANGAEAPYPDADHAGTMLDLQWASDARALLYVRGAELVRLDLASGEVTVLHTAAEGVVSNPLDRGGTVTVVEQCCYDDGTGTLERATLVTVGGGAAPLPQPVTDRQLSANGIELRAYQDGSLVWLGDGDEGTLGSGYTAADW